MTACPSSLSNRLIEIAIDKKLAECVEYITIKNKNGESESYTTIEQALRRGVRCNFFAKLRIYACSLDFKVLALLAYREFYPCIGIIRIVFFPSNNCFFVSSNIIEALLRN